MGQPWRGLTFRRRFKAGAESRGPTQKSTRAINVQGSIPEDLTSLRFARTIHESVNNFKYLDDFWPVATISRGRALNYWTPKDARGEVSVAAAPDWATDHRSQRGGLM